MINSDNSLKDIRESVPSVTLIQKFLILSLMLCGILTDEIILGINLMIILYFMLKTKRIRLSNAEISIPLLAITHGLINCLIGNNNFLSMGKQIVGIAISYLCYRLAFENCNIQDVFKFYIKIALILCSIIWVQQVAFFLHIRILSNLSWISPRLRYAVSTSGLLRAAGLMNEPAAFCAIISPAVFIAIYSLFQKKRDYMSLFEIVVVIGAVLLSTSSVGLICIMISMYLYATNSGFFSIKKIIVILLIILGFLLAYSQSSLFRIRVDDVLALLTRMDTNRVINISSSTYVLHLKTCINVFKNTFGLGGGLGSYSTMFDKVGDASFYGSLELLLNKEDAGSLLFRMIGDFGIFSFIIYYAVYRKYNVHTESSRNIHRIIFLSLITFFLIKMLRSGHYFYNGFWLFYILMKINKEEYLKRSLRIEE